MCDRAHALGRTTAFTYDAQGHMTSADGPLAGTSDKGTFGYDASHRLVSITDGANRTVTMQYDALDRLIEETSTLADEIEVQQIGRAHV